MCGQERGGQSGVEQLRVRQALKPFEADRGGFGGIVFSGEVVQGLLVLHASAKLRATLRSYVGPGPKTATAITAAESVQLKKLEEVIEDYPRL